MVRQKVRKRKIIIPARSSIPAIWRPHIRVKIRVEPIGKVEECKLIHLELEIDKSVSLDFLVDTCVLRFLTIPGMMILLIQAIMDPFIAFKTLEKSKTISTKKSLH